jgi:hypothetical protein
VTEGIEPAAFGSAWQNRTLSEPVPWKSVTTPGDLASQAGSIQTSLLRYSGFGFHLIALSSFWGPAQFHTAYKFSDPVCVDKVLGWQDDARMRKVLIMA